MKNLLKEYLKTNICADEIQEYTIIGDSANALSIIQSAAKEYMKFYNQIEFSIFKNETNDTYAVWTANRNSRSIDDAWYFSIDPNSLSEYYINFCLVRLRESISKVLGGQKIKSIKYKNSDNN